MTFGGLFGPPTLADGLVPEEQACRKCGLHRSAISHPQIKPYGAFKKRIMIVGEAPGEEEDRAGRPWQGPAGRLLQAELKRFGIDLFQDCISYSSVNCRPTTIRKGRAVNRDPSNKELLQCRNLVLRAVYSLKPSLLILLGGLAVQSVIGARWSKDLGGVNRWRGFTIPDRELKTWICPSFSPSTIEEIDDSRRVPYLTVFRQDLQRMLAKLEEPLPQWEDEKKQVVIVEDTGDLVRLLRDARLVAWDLETTGLKPYDTSVHKILAAAFCPSEDVSYVTPYPDMRALKRILYDDRIKKIAQHDKFDSMWAWVYGGYEPRGRVWDTMLASHVEDNRPGITGLKFQAYVRFGLVGYDDLMEPYLQGSNRKDTNSTNGLEEAMRRPDLRKEALLYCGVDALLTRRIALQQMEALGASYHT